MTVTVETLNKIPRLREKAEDGDGYSIRMKPGSQKKEFLRKIS